MRIGSSFGSLSRNCAHFTIARTSIVIERVVAGVFPAFGLRTDSVQVVASFGVVNIEKSALRVHPPDTFHVSLPCAAGVTRLVVFTDLFRARIRMGRRGGDGSDAAMPSAPDFTPTVNV